MALRHERFSVVGIQFHPESVLTEHGHALLANFLRAEADETPGSSKAHASPLGGSRQT